MLPGFRFLFAAIMLSASLLVFGLGAASLFRAAHQAFASNPSWRGAADLSFAQKGEMAAPVLATLRVDAPRLDRPQSEVAVVPQVAPPVEPVTLEPEGAPGLAAPIPADARPAEIADPDDMKAELPAVQNPPAIETAEPAPELSAKSDQTKLAAVASLDAPPANSDPTIAPLEPSPTKPGPTATNPAAAPEPSSNTPAKIATLGGPPAEAVQDNPRNENAAKPDSAKSDQNAIKKRLRARRAAQRRRLAARARLAAQQLLLQQQQSDPFAQPFPPIAPITPPTPAPTRRAPKKNNHAAPVAIGGPPV